MLLEHLLLLLKWADVLVNEITQERRTDCHENANCEENDNVSSDITLICVETMINYEEDCSINNFYNRNQIAIKIIKNNRD